jgi:hypothetical protein
MSQDNKTQEPMEKEGLNEPFACGGPDSCMSSGPHLDLQPGTGRHRPIARQIASLEEAVTCSAARQAVHDLVRTLLTE